MRVRVTLIIFRSILQNLGTVNCYASFAVKLNHNQSAKRGDTDTSLLHGVHCYSTCF